jgi:signal transduction histidine kinase
MNLLENALRHTPSGGKIIVRAAIKEARLTVEVIDTGPGLKEKDMPHLFEPYFSTEKGYKKTSGLGLGLPLSKMLVELHGGNIWAKNESERGANIGFSIPISQVACDKKALQEKKYEDTRN